MRVPVRMPDLGAESIRFGLWLVEPGEHVYEGDRVAEVLVYGACVDVAAPATGTLAERLVQARDVLVPGQVIGMVEAEADDSD